jgi:UDP-glucuronate decarboxylase
MNSILLKDIPVEKLRDKRIYITGATGLVGTHFLSAFTEVFNMGINLTVFAQTHRDVPQHLREYLFSRHIHFVNEPLRADIIIHAATYAQPNKFMTNQADTLYLNTTLTNSLLENYLINGGSFLFISSSEVYSGLGSPPFVETQIGTTDPYHPRACYIEGKRCGEAIVNAYRNVGVDAKSVRLCLAYGDGTRDDDQRAMSTFIRSAILRKEIELKGDGSAIRTYCYVKDAVNMMLRVLLEGKNVVYNIGGVSTITISELVNLIGELTGANVITNNTEGSSGAPSKVSLVNHNYIKEFGERDFVSLRDGLAKTIEYNRKIYE